MATLKYWAYAEIESNGVIHRMGRKSNESPYAITTSGIAFDKTYDVATSGTQKIYDVDVDASNFDWLMIQTDYNLNLQLVTDDDANNGEEDYVIGLLGSGTAGEFGPPFILPTDDGKANFTVDTWPGTDDVIERLNVYNDTANTARVRILALT